jgi:nucleoside-diphosphate-sugar epimerase
MRVFVAGATGVIGRPLLPMLVEGGHQVTAMTRSHGKAERLRAAGAEPEVCDAYDVDAPHPWRRAIAALLVLEETVTRTPGIEGVVLRYGFFYGPGTSYAADGGIARQVRGRRFPIVGKGDGMLSFIHLEDAARATVLACERGAPGIYNVVDDDPARLRDWLPVYAEALGAKRPLRVPVWLARLGGGPVAARLAVGRGASNARARRDLGWEPRYPSWRQGFREALG